MADVQHATGGEIAMGVTYTVASAGVIGGAVSAALGPGKWWEKVLRGIVGTTTAAFGHHVTAIVMVGLLDIPFDAPNLPTVREMEPIAAFLVGLIGMSLCQMAVNSARAARDHVPDYIEGKLDQDEGAK